MEAGFSPMRPGELARLREAERAGCCFLVYRDGEGVQCLHRLATDARVVVGRRAGSDLVLDWDERVSRTHAEIEHVGSEWIISDDGLSRNGTFLNGERVHGRRRLCDRDVIRVGNTSIMFRAPASGVSQATVVPDSAETITLSDGQRKVLLALCRPYSREPERATPARNDEIAAELFLSVDAVKAHLRALFHKFGVDDAPQIEKRTRLARKALESGIVNLRALD
jgi:predicted component of type VI protein secretion system